MINKFVDFIKENYSEPEYKVDELVSKFREIYPTPLDMIKLGVLTEENSLADLVIDFLEDEMTGDKIKTYLTPIIDELLKQGYGEAWKEL